MCALGLGVGRNRAEDAVLPHTGLVFKKKCGDSVAAGDTVCEIYAPDDVAAESALGELREAVEAGPGEFRPSPLILKERGAL